MKILISMFDLSNMGGIINHTENLLAAFKELGHEVDMCKLVWRNSAVGTRTTTPEQYIPGELYPINQERGWIFPDGKRIPYKGAANIKLWKQYASKFDLIIWETPIPTKQKANIGNIDWLDIYDVPVKQIVIIHDGNFLLYPHLYEIRKHITGLVCVHPCAYHSAKISIPKAMIFNPFDVPGEFDWEPYKNRRKGIVSVANFKGWKHVDDLIRAVPYIDEDISIIVAGGGIEQRYMTSKTKCKETYKVDGVPIWDTALDMGMKYLGFVHNQKRDKILKKYRTLVDTAWSKKYATVGGHFNRTTIEAALLGTIPVARNFGVSTNEEGIGEVLVANKHYIMIPYNSTPEEFGEIISYANNLPNKLVDSIWDNWMDLLGWFDRNFVAREFISLANGKNAGWYNKIEISKTSKIVIEKSTHLMETFFGAK